MTDDRGTRGRRVLGHRRLFAYLAATCGVMVAAFAPMAAAGSSGGAGLGATPRTTRTVKAPIARSGQSNPLAARGMWIWYVSQSNGGNLASIIARAHHYGIKTLMIKSGDGTNVWSQFTPGLVSKLHANGLQVCAWQYVYGNSPVTEARVGASAVKRGADCLMIDAESEYEHKYVQAQSYITTLRKLVGSTFPVALAGFPYVDFHPAFPYSVFLGPGGAQYNAPQMYWFDIGTSVDSVYAHTYVFNRVYQRPIFPLGELTGPPSNRDIIRFRQLSLAYGAGGISWWNWQEAGNTWHEVGEPVGTLANFVPATSYATLGKGGAGDVVVWAQEHLVSAGQKIAIDGNFGSLTVRAVRRFQAAGGLPVTGVVNSSTWQALLRYAPTRVHWTRRSTAASIASAGSQLTPVPKSASLPAVRDEIAGPGGVVRGRH